MGDSEWVVGVDVAVRGIAEIVEDVGLQRVCRLHYEGVEVQPPEPASAQLGSGLLGGFGLTIQHPDTFSWNSESHPLSPSSLSTHAHIVSSCSYPQSLARSPIRRRIFSCF